MWNYTLFLSRSPSHPSLPRYSAHPGLSQEDWTGMTHVS